MKVSCIYDQGSAPHREDGFFLCGPFFGVLDGVSAPHGPKYPPKMFYRMSGGEFVARTVEECFSRFGGSSYFRPLSEVLGEAITSVGLKQKSFGLTNNAGQLAGVTFTIVSISDRPLIEIVQAGDCLGVVELKDGSIYYTRNQVRLHDTEMNDEIERIQREVAREQFGITLEEATLEQRSNIRGEMWNRFYPILTEARRQDVNNAESRRCYGLLNGQPKLFDVAIHLELERERIQRILLFSDGMIPWNVMKSSNDQEIADAVLDVYRQGGLPKLLATARGQEEKVKSTNYMDFAEATAIAIEF